MTALLFLAMTLTNITFAQKNSKNIIKSTDIQEIEAYLKTTHPDDPKKTVLKRKLVHLKNEQWTQGKHTAKPMEARPFENIPSHVSEAEEFNRLILSNPQQHKDKTVQLLNTMFNEDISSKDIILLLKNETNCNLILRIQGKGNYNMAIASRGENFIVINKGSYTLTSNVCNNTYSSKKVITKGTLLTINNTKEEIKSSGISNKNEVIF